MLCPHNLLKNQLFLKKVDFFLQTNRFINRFVNLRPLILQRFLN
jgi:hypothetical protein